MIEMENLITEKRYTGALVCKAGSVDCIPENIAKGLSTMDNFQIDEIVILFDKEIQDFKNNLFEECGCWTEKRNRIAISK